MCCGQSTGRVTPSLLSSAVPAGQAGQWEITYPSGNSRKFPTEWQAEASRAVGGGSIEFIPADAPPADEVAADAPPADEVVAAEVVEDTTTTAAAAVSSSTSTEQAPAVSEPATPPAPKPTPPKSAVRKPTRARKAAATPKPKPPAKGSTSN